jgi:hypothetical protein
MLFLTTKSFMHMIWGSKSLPMLKNEWVPENRI